MNPMPCGVYRARTGQMFEQMTLVVAWDDVQYLFENVYFPRHAS